MTNNFDLCLNAHLAGYDQIATHTTSPIEKSFGAWVSTIWQNEIGGPLTYSVSSAPDPLPEGLTIVQQYKVGKFKCDFALFIAHKKLTPASVIVECDGHKFHEKTKQQVARDRARDRLITLAGYRVLHFTGSEIHTDPVSCVAETFRHLGAISCE